MIDLIHLYGLPHPMNLLAYPFYYFFRLKLWIKGIELRAADEFYEREQHLRAMAGNITDRAALAMRYAKHLPETFREHLVNDYVQAKFAAEKVAAPTSGTDKITADPGFNATLDPIGPKAP